MKKILILLLIFLLIPTSIMAEESQVIEVIEEDEFLYERSSLNLQGFRARGAVGPKVGMAWLNLDELNDILAEENSGLAEFDNQMLVLGGSIVGGYREGPRFGILTMNGQQEVIGDEDKAAKFRLLYGGLITEYGLYAGSRSDIALGAMIGGGRLALDVRHEEAEDLESGLNNSQGTTAIKNFFVFKPRANLHYKLTPYLALDLNTGYLLTYNSSGKWDIMGTEVDDPTGNLHGPTLAMKLNFGF